MICEMFMIFWFENNNNNVGKNTQLVFFLSSRSFGNHGLLVTHENLRFTISLFNSRRLFGKHSWLIHDDVYLSQ
jgi:hypothetical protein